MSASVAAATKKEALRRVWRIVRPRRGLGAASILLASLSLLCAIGLIATSAWLISRAWQQPPIMYLGVAVVAVRAFGLGRGVFRYSERLVSHSAALRGLTRLRVALVERIAVVAPGGVSSLRRGDAMRRFVDDVDATAEYGLRTVFPRRTALVTGFVVIALMAWLLPSAAVIVLVGLLVAGVLTPMLTKRVGHTAATTEVHVKGDLAAEVLSVLNASAEISAANAQDSQVSGVVELDDRVLTAEKRTASSMGSAAALGVAAQGLALIGVVLVAVPAVRSGQLDGVNLAVVVLLPLVVFEIVAGLPVAALWQARAQASADRIVDVLDADQVVADPDVTRSLAIWSVPPRLDVDMASVRWPGSDRDAASDISFQLAPGERLAIVGPSGSGKSSIAAGLVKFAPMLGDVRLGGVSYSSLSGDAVRSAIGYCEQNAHIFDNTIAENLRLADRTATDEQLEDALSRVKLLDWVQSLPHGISTLVGEHGSQLSGGQRQRIAVARVLLSDHPVVILDEPTEHVDPTMAAELTADIFASLAGKSVIFITHTDEALAYVDQVLDLGASRYASDMTVVGS